MKELQELARKLLSAGTVKVVIGYEEGPRGARPAFITDPKEADKLIFDTRCVQNLATYLNPRRKQITQLGKAAVVVKGCDARAVAGLIRENQIERANVVIIAMQCGGVLQSPETDSELTSETVSVRCGGCEVCEPKLYDHYLELAHTPLKASPEPPVNTQRTEQIAALKKLTPAERWSFWSDHLSRCIRCHACREACPMCFCVQCTAEKSQPLWIDPSATPRANRAWQTMRMLHQAGRCVDCLECERACPEHIPLGLLAGYVADAVDRRFDYKVCDDPSVPAPMGVYRTDDDEEFIR
jgi:formate dehydrogenase (coenzyme F420) beta subunit